MNHERIIYSGTAVVAAAGIAVSAAGCGTSSPSNASPSSATYYQAGYTYALVKDGPAQQQILRQAGYAKWCASATAATTDLNTAPPGRAHEKAASEWVNGCNAYSASVGLPAAAAPLPPPPPAPAPIQAPAQAPSSTSPNPLPSPPAPSPSQPPPQPSQPPQQGTSVPPGMFAWPGGGFCNIPFNEQFFQQNGVPGVCQPAGTKHMP